MEADVKQSEQAQHLTKVSAEASYTEDSRLSCLLPYV